MVQRGHGTLILVANPTIDVPGTVAEVGSDWGPNDADPGTARRDPTKIGRFLVIRRQGEGGMGIVYAAYDPELDRRIAIKLIRPDRRKGSKGKSRLLREAQAMARIEHPNVISVYDVGTLGDSVYIAMELVEGQTLARWMDRSRPWRDTVATLSAAGAGLAAAHAAGLVHRDFKPQNVLVGGDGRVKVLDFGIVRALDDEPTEPGDGAGIARAQEAMVTAGGTNGGLVINVSQTRGLIGTPAYMAPEQLEEEEVDERGDQFSFAVTLYEALYGERPYPGETVAEIATSIDEGRVQDPPRDSDVPTWLRRAILRGLSIPASGRYPSMAAMLDAINTDPGRARGRWLRASGLVVLAAGASWGLTQAAGGTTGQCQADPGELAQAWSDAQRERARAAFDAVDVPYARATFETAASMLDAYAAEWLDARVDACEDSTTGQQSARMLDLRNACLDRSRQDLAALVGVFESADVEVVDRSIQAVSRLPGLERCADTERMLATIPPPDDAQLAQQVAQLRKGLASVRAEQNAGRYQPALDLATPLAAEAENTNYAPIAAEAKLLRGTLLEQTGSYPQAEDALQQSLWAAMGSHHDEVVADAATKLALVVGDRLTRPEEGLVWQRTASAAVDRLGEDIARRAGVLHALGSIREEQGKYDEARVAFESSLELQEQRLGKQHPEVGASLSQLGNAIARGGDYEAAKVPLRRALEIYEVTLPADHPQVAYATNNLALTLARQGKYAQAEELFRRALEIWRGALGEDHGHVAEVVNNVGSMLSSQNKHEESREYLERALGIWERVAGPDEQRVARPLNNLGVLENRMGNYRKAAGYFERSLAIREKTLGPDHPGLAFPLNGLGNAHLHLGEPASARDYYQRGLAVREAALGADHVRLGFPLTGLARALIDLEEYDAAIGHLERALTLRTAQEVDPADLGETRFHLARALWESNRDRPRALELARQARDDYSRAPELGSQGVESVDRWLTSR